VNRKSLIRFLQSWFINTLAVLIAVYVLHGRIHYERTLDLFVASLLLGIFNAVLRPVLMFIALPFLLMTLGLFTLIINAGLLYLVSFLMQPQFSVNGFGSAFWGALIISIVSLILNTLTGAGHSRIQISRQQRRPPDRGGDGPVIDI
jgi:putative membrane protein